MTPQFVEEALTRHYLRTDGGHDAGPLKFIDATPRELARAFEMPLTQAEEAKRCFLLSFNAKNVHGELCVDHPPFLRFDRETPGFFRHLILSCLIAATGTDASANGQFRPRLAELLATPRTFQNFYGLPLRWKALARWCSEKRRRGEPYREIKLPTDDDIGYMSQIGHSVQISFPARSDQERMVRFFGDIDRTNPRSVVTAVRSRQYESWSSGFTAAFKDFEDLFNKGYRVLADHPFWLAMQRIATEGTNDDQDNHFGIILTTDIEEETVFSLVTSDPKALAELKFGGGQGSSKETMVVEIEADTAIDKIRVSSSTPLGLKQSAREGIIVFEETDCADWRAVRHAQTALVRLWIRPDIKQYFGDLKGQLEHWFLTTPINWKVADSILARVRPRDAAGSAITKAMVTGGVRLGRTRFLGLPGFLPHISASEKCTITLSRSKGCAGKLTLDDRLKPRFALETKEKLEGSWTATAEEQGHVAAEINLRFESKSPEHDFSNIEINPSLWRQDCETLNAADEARVDLRENGDYQICSEAGNDIFSFLEALYAQCERGMTEQEIVPFVAAHSGAPRQWAWDVLRVLQESGWIEPRISTGWRARKWFLRPPRLLFLPQAKVIVLVGAACETVRKRFVHNVERAGGTVCMRVLPEAWSVPVLVGFVEKNIDLAADIGVPEADPHHELPMAQMLDGPTVVLGEAAIRTFKTATTWSWSSGGFVAKNFEAGSDVKLDRLEHNGHRSNDLFRVSGSKIETEIFSSRAAAIIAAHRKAGKQLFKYDARQKLIMRTARQGWLPMPVATYLRLSNLVGSGLYAGENGTYRYVYSADGHDAQKVRLWIGNIVNGASDEKRHRNDTSYELEEIVFNRVAGRAAACAVRQFLKLDF